MLGFQISNYDTCLYCKGDGGKILYIWYFMQMISFSTVFGKSEIDDIKQKLKFEFEMKDLDFAKKILRMKIIRDKIKIYCT